MKTFKVTLTCLIIFTLILNGKAITPTCSAISSLCTDCIYDPISGNPKCIQCSSGRYPNSVGSTCVSCSSAISGCSTCLVEDGKTRCKVCNFLYPSKDGLSCVSCGTAYTGCSSCFYLQPGRVGCQSCSSGYPSKKFECLPCSSAINNCGNCKSDSSTGYLTQCTSCLNGLFPSKYRYQCVSCQQAIQDCKRCQNSNGQTICSQCCSGKFLSQDHKKCLSCNSIINKCLSCKVQSITGNTLCQKCSSDLTQLFPSIDKKYCQACSLAIENCRECQNIHGDTFCIYCQNGYFIANQQRQVCNLCSVIDANCIDCVTDYQNLALGGLCLNCAAGYFVSTTRDSCLQCSSITGCIQCQNLPNGGGACTVCSVGFFLQNNVCTPCTSPCTQCQGKINGANMIVQSCLVCSTGFYLDQNFACNTCSSAITNCTNCSPNPNIAGTICNVCQNTFYPTLNSLSCQQCSSFGCSTCTIQNGITVCLTCPANQFTSSCKRNCGSCSSIIPLCLACSPKLVASCVNCNELLNAYISPDGLCKSCQSLIKDCLVCDDSSGTTLCNSCKNGLFLSSNKLSCNYCQITNCATCLTSTACSRCIAGYYLDAGQCKPCGANCIFCSKLSATRSICTKCVGNLIADSDGSCKACNAIIPSCTLCKGATIAQPTVTCLSTSIPQIVNGCYYNCLTCNSTNPYQCLSCDTKRFYLHYDYCHPLRFPASPTRI